MAEVNSSKEQDGYKYDLAPGGEKREGPWGQHFYDGAKYNGQNFVERLRTGGPGLTPQQISRVLGEIFFTFAYDRATLVNEPGNSLQLDPTFQRAQDWVLEVVASAQDYLAEKEGITPPPGGSDARRSRRRPSNKFIPPTSY